MSAEVLLLRHGQTAGNALRQYIGATDEPLSDAGRAALSKLSYPAAERVYVSPLCRCRETAAILFPGAEQCVVPGLREMDFGHFERRSFCDMERDAEYRAWIDSGCEAPIPGGESKAEFTARCCAAFSPVLTRHGNDRAVFVVHGGTIMAILSRFGVPERGYYDWTAANGHGFLLSREEGGLLRLITEV